jgi:predicted nucleic acid-binding protein
VTRYLLDTNIVSELIKPQRSTSLHKWLRRQDDRDLFLTTVSVGEIWRGILELRFGRRRRELETWFAGPEGPQILFAGRILPFDLKAAMEWARIMAEGTATGRPRSALDMVIAATAAANDCVVVTANERHFEGTVEFLNPLRPAG